MLSPRFLKTYFTIILLLLFQPFSFAEGFIKNQGQLPNNVFAKKNVKGGALFIEQAKLTFSFYDQIQLKNFHNRVGNNNNINFHSYSVSFLNTNKSLDTKFLNKLDFTENYYLGDSSSWATGVNHYQKHIQKNIYKGIDLLIYNHDNNLKYDLLLSKESNYKDIKIKYSGHSSITLKEGNVVISTSVNTITELRPYAYQIIDNDTVEVLCNYVLKKDKLSFDFPYGYDNSNDLVIDPTLIFSTYSGSISDNFGYTATYDNDGYLYSGSTAFGVDYPTTLGAYQQSFQGGVTDIAITKYDTTGTYRIYSTYLGGSSDELPHSMVVNSNNELFVLGTTGSADFPITQDVVQPVFNGGTSFFPSGLGVSFANGSDMFITKINKNGGALLSSTFLGGTNNDGLNISSRLKYNYADEVRGEIDVDINNNIYVASSTSSNDFPVTQNAFNQTLSGDQDGCIIKIDNQLSTIIWSSFLGGSKDDAVYSLELDEKNNIYVTGGTISSDFPTTALAYNTSYNDSLNPDAFITKINNDGSFIVASTFFGSEAYDQAYFIELNNLNDIYILGQTRADSLSLVFNTNYYVPNGGQFISVFDNKLENLIRSTMLGTGKGTPDISPTAFLVDKCNNIYMSGWGSNLGGALSTLNLPITQSTAFQNTTDGNDFYLAVFNEFIDSLQYATYFGGNQSTEHVDGGTSRFDKNGIVYQSVCAGCGGNNDFPIYPNPGAVSTTNNSPNCNNAVFKFDFKRPIVIADFIAPSYTCTTSVSFINNSTTNQVSNANYFWDFGDGTTSTLTNPNHQYQTQGIYTVKLIASSNQACNFSDTISKEVFVLTGTADTLSDVVKCSYSNIQIGLPSILDSSLNFNWTPNNFLNNNSISNPYTSTDTSTNYRLVISGNQCNDTLYQKVLVNELSVSLPDDTSYCSQPILINPVFTNPFDQILWSSNNSFSDTLSQQLNYLSSSASTYHVKITDSLCYAIDSVKILSDLIDIHLLADSISCGFDTLLISVENNTPNNPITNYAWSSSDSIIYDVDSSSVRILTTNSNWHYVEVVNSVGCYMKDSLYIIVYPRPIIDSLWASSDNVPLGLSTELNILSNDSVLWYNQLTNPTIQITPDLSSWYNVTVSNGFCELIDSVYVAVREVYCNLDSIVIPTAFTPNFDGVNDTYKIKNNGVDIVSFNISIYNRLGQLVFNSNDINFNWNGRFKSVELQPQVFDFFIEMTCAGNTNLFTKGNITLLR